MYKVVIKVIRGTVTNALIACPIFKLKPCQSTSILIQSEEILVLMTQRTLNALYISKLDPFNKVRFNLLQFLMPLMIDSIIYFALPTIEEQQNEGIIKITK